MTIFTKPYPCPTFPWSFALTSISRRSWFIRVYHTFLGS